MPVALWYIYIYVIQCYEFLRRKMHGNVRKEVNLKENVNSENRFS